MIHECFRVIDMTGGILNLFPMIRYIAPVLSGYQPLLDVHKPIWNFLGEVVAEIRANQSSDRSKSFIAAFLDEISNRYKDDDVHRSFSGKWRILISKINVDSSSFSCSFQFLMRFHFTFLLIHFTDEQLLSVCLDFFQAGTETTSNTLSFGLMYMIHNRRVNDKVHNELDAVVGRKRLPNLNDRNHLPYVEAVLSEIQRFSSVAPLGIVHRTTEDCRFFHYDIPKDTVALVSLYSLNMDKEYWKDPDVFRPERFLNENGEYVQHSEQFFPFGLGKRRCMGENLAKSSLFLFFATFMHSFDMILPNGTPMPNTQPDDGITLQPKPFQIQLKIRT